MKSDEKKLERYLKVPNHILNIPRSKLDFGEKFLLAHFYSFGTSGCYQSNKTLGKMFFVSARTISIWIAKLKKGGFVLWLNPKGYFRTIWAKSHPEVKSSQTLKYRGENISKGKVVSGEATSISPRNRLRSECAKNCVVSAQKTVVPLRNAPIPTNNNTIEERITMPVPLPLPAGGQTPALLQDRLAETVEYVDQIKTKLGIGKKTRKVLTEKEFQDRKQKQRKALLAVM